MKYIGGEGMQRIPPTNSNVLQTVKTLLDAGAHPVKVIP